ncbi:MAG: lamin tail domain-containing protein [Candidatus Omnitrophica bacterium]|nr:lamin tail domain-containing protein [Candidatus Omnitrophota bacterium]
MKILKTVLVLAFCLLLSAYSQAAVIINEAMIDPNASSDTYGEWIELYNPENLAVDINQWIIRDIDTNYHQINNNGPLVIPAFGFLVLGRNADTGLNGGYNPDYIYSSFQLSNTADELILENTGAEEISRIDYTASWPLFSGQSIAYTGNGELNNPANWIATPQSPEYIFGQGDYGTPGYANTIPEPSAFIMWLIGLSGIFSFKRKR